MALTDEQAAAHEQLEAAIDELIRTRGKSSPDEITIGFVLIVNGTRSATPEDDCDDDLEAIGTYHTFIRRGQQPTLSRGIVECWIDEFRKGDD